MNRIEVTGLLAYLDRLGLLAFKPGMEDAWFDVVSHLSADDATTAARRLAAQDLPDGRFVARPGDVIDAVGQIRRERIRAGDCDARQGDDRIGICWKCCTERANGDSFCGEYGGRSRRYRCD